MDAAAAAFDQADVAGGIGDLGVLVELAAGGRAAAQHEREEIALVEIPPAVEPEVEGEGAAVRFRRVVAVKAGEEIVGHIATERVRMDGMAADGSRGGGRDEIVKYDFIIYISGGGSSSAKHCFGRSFSHFSRAGKNFSDFLRICPETRLHDGGNVVHL